MKIGLVSYFSRNYGALLQGYALQEILKEFGHEVIAINRGWMEYGNLVWNFNYSFSDRIKKALVNFPFDDFVRNEINMSMPIASLDDLKRISTELDVIISGSDQIWNADTILYMDYYFFLDWVNGNTRKLSYAASFGRDTFEVSREKKQMVRKLLGEYEALSVRESSGVDICQNEFGLFATQHLDPTLLLTKAKYLSLLRPGGQSKHPYFCTYVLDSSMEVEKLIAEVIQKSNLERIDNFAQPTRFLNQLKHKKERMPTVYQWLSNIANSKFVVTDSFHGTVFSIIFHKSFVCVNNKERGSARFESLLKSVGLEERLVDLQNDSSEKITKLLNQDIDYVEVDKKLEALRNDSLEFLRSI